jgi:hypothetical protein
LLRTSHPGCLPGFDGGPRADGSTASAPAKDQPDAFQSRQAESGKKGTVMLNGPKGTENDSIAPCSVCGHLEELFELPGRAEKCCLECSADMATAMLLSTEIDAATLAGRSTDALVSEFSQVSSRMLERSQSA